MSFTHYPKLAEGSGLFGSVLWYGKGDPRNTLAKPLKPGESVSIYGSAVNFTRYLGTTYSDQPLEISFAFGNEEVVLVPLGHLVEAENPMTHETILADDRLPADIRGAFPVVNGLREATDEDLPSLNYDGVALVINYQPGKEGKPAIGDKGTITIYGSVLRITVKNVGSAATSSVRHYTRASVF